MKTPCLSQRFMYLPWKKAAEMHRPRKRHQRREAGQFAQLTQIAVCFKLKSCLQNVHQQPSTLSIYVWFWDEQQKTFIVVPLYTHIVYTFHVKRRSHNQTYKKIIIKNKPAKLCVEKLGNTRTIMTRNSDLVLCRNTLRTSL